MSAPELFWRDFSVRHEFPPPDHAMAWEIEGAVARYVGPGERPYQYSLRFVAAPADAAAEIGRETARADARGRSMEWIVQARPPIAGVHAALLAAGFVLKARPRLLYRATDDPLPPSPSVDVRRVLGVADVEDVRRVLLDVWNDPADAVVESLRRECERGAGRTHAYVVDADGRPVACAWMKYYGKIAYLFGGSTLMPYRGRKIYTNLVATRMARARADGVAYAVSDCTPDSERVLRKLGFADGGETLKYVRPASK